MLEGAEFEAVVGEDLDEAVIAEEAEVDAAIADGHGHGGFAAGELELLHVDDEGRAAQVERDLGRGADFDDGVEIKGRRLHGFERVTLLVEHDGLEVVMLCAQCFDLAHGLPDEARAASGVSQSDLAGDVHHLRKGHAGEKVIAHLGPALLHHAAIAHVAVVLTGVVGAAIRTVQEIAGALELATVEVTNKILAEAAVDDPLRFVGAFDLHREEVGAFGEADDAAFALPLLQIGRGEEHELARFALRVLRIDRRELFALLGAVQDHHPALRGLVPVDFGVAIVVRHLGQHGIAGILRPGATAIIAEGESLITRRAGGGVDEHERRFFAGLKAGGVLPIDHARAGEHHALRLRMNRDGQLLPMQEIAAHRMPPALAAAFDAVGMQLVKQVMLTVEAQQAIRVVQAPTHRGEMKLRPPLLRIHRQFRFDRITALDGRDQRRWSAEHRRLAFPWPHFEKHPQIRLLPLGELDLHLAHGLASDFELHHLLRCPIANGQVEQVRVQREGSRDGVLSVDLSEAKEGDEERAHGEMQSTLETQLAPL